LQELAAKIATEDDQDKFTAKEFNKLVDDEKQPQESKKLAPDSRLHLMRSTTFIMASALRGGPSRH
jgi:hypothetical protein